MSSDLPHLLCCMRLVCCNYTWNVSFRNVLDILFMLQSKMHSKMVLLSFVHVRTYVEWTVIACVFVSVCIR